MEAYVEDIFVCSKTKEEHLKDLRETFGNIRAARLRLKAKKVCLRGRGGSVPRVPHNAKRNKTKERESRGDTPDDPARTIEEVQRINGQVPTLNHYLPRSVDKYHPFFHILKATSTTVLNG